MMELCDGRYGAECTRFAVVFWPAGGNKWCKKHAPEDSGWLPEDDTVVHDGDPGDLCWTCDEPWPCTATKERAEAWGECLTCYGTGVYQGEDHDEPCPDCKRTKGGAR